MSKLYYTGIGSRETPQEILDKMWGYARILGERGWTLRSGGAEGADTAFEEGCKKINGECEIYLPWENFNGRGNAPPYYVTGNDKKAHSFAKEFHPNWKGLGQGTRKLMARNAHQLLGINLDMPSQLVICWHDTNNMFGGTLQNIRTIKRLNTEFPNNYNFKLINLFEGIRNCYGDDKVIEAAMSIEKQNEN